MTWNDFALAAAVCGVGAAAWLVLRYLLGGDHPLLHLWQSLGALIARNNFGRGEPWID